MKQNQALIDFIQGRLDSLGLGYVQAATRAGLERGYIRDIFKGRKGGIMASNIPALAFALETTTDELSRAAQGRSEKQSSASETKRLSPQHLALAGELTDFGHRLLQRVYYEDTDFTGVVYHARYLHFFERGRTDYLRLTGVHHTELDDGAHGERLAWIVRRMEIDFKSPARIDDVLTIETRTLELSGARITMGQMILRNGQELAAAKVEAALVNGEGKPRRFPKDWIEAFRPKAAAARN